VVKPLNYALHEPGTNVFLLRLSTGPSRKRSQSGRGIPSGRTANSTMSSASG
jgi:hypothetical protein